MLTIKAEVSGGAAIQEACEDLCLLASRLGCIVRAEMNGVVAMAKPGSDPRDLFQLWERELESKRSYKVVCAQPVELERPWERPAPQHSAGQSK